MGMQGNTKDAAILKHYKNIRQITLQQLEAIKKGDLSALAASLQQRELIIGNAKDFHTGVAMDGLQTETIEKIRELLSETTAIDEACQKILSEGKEAVSKKMVAFRKGKVLHQAYDTPLSTGYVVNRTK
jgi:hypothetical protein